MVWEGKMSRNANKKIDFALRHKDNVYIYIYVRIS